MHPTTHPCPPNRRIVLIDDNPSIHADVGKILQPAGQQDLAAIRRSAAALFEGVAAPSLPAETESFELASAFQGEEGVALAREAARAEKPFALAIVDCRMPPGIDGIRTIEQLWSVCPDIQVVLCTAYSDYSWEQITEILGTSDGLVILKKPFDVAELRQLAESMTLRWNRNADMRRRVLTLRRQSEQRAEALAESRLRLERAVREAGMANAVKEALSQLPHVLDLLEESAAKVALRLQESKVGCVGRLAGILRENEAHLGAFGQKLPGFLSEIGKDLAHERGLALHELTRLQHTIDSLRDLVRVAGPASSPALTPGGAVAGLIPSAAGELGGPGLAEGI